VLTCAIVNIKRGKVEDQQRKYKDDCIAYRKILNMKDVEKLQTDLDILGDWAE